jgi:hypothetical protein
MANGNDALGDFISRAMRELLGQAAGSGGLDDVWARATDPGKKTEPSKSEQRENLAFALAGRAVTALEDIALNVAAVRQRLEKTTRTVTAAGDRGGLRFATLASADARRRTRLRTVRYDAADTERPDGLWND